MLDNIMDTIKSTIGDKLTGELNMDSNQADGVIDTIKGFVTENKDSDKDEAGLGEGLMSALSSKNGLTGDIASKVKDMVMPMITKFMSGGIADAVKGGLSGAAGKIGGMFK